MKKLIATVTVLAISVTLLGIATAGASPTDELQALKAATARYHSFEQAERAGYSVAGEPCVAAPPGTMGIHAVNPALIGDPATDALRPDILLYVPTERGKLELVGVEYLTFALANTESGPRLWFGPTPPPMGFLTPAPSVFGQTFDGPMEGHTPTMPWHYDLHVWVWADNPSGMFAMFNPSLACSAT